MKATGLLFLTLCVLYATADFNTRVIGGEDAKAGQFPYQISLRNRLGNSHFCGGSILNSRFLLTAAHCTQGINRFSLLVYAVVGASNRLNGGLNVRLNKITPHKGFNMNVLEYDISLLRAAKNIVFTNLIQPIALPTHKGEDNSPVILSGWGVHEFPPTKPLPEILQFAELRTYSQEKCREDIGNHPEFGGLVRVHDSNICTISASGIGACFGDSGGPLVDISNPGNETLVGIVSWGVPCATAYPDVFTRVHSHLGWIQSNIAAQS